ncbi:hypothetical protein ACLB2K_002471 [Fragaria x ananassa]
MVYISRKREWDQDQNRLVSDPDRPRPELRRSSAPSSVKQLSPDAKRPSTDPSRRPQPPCDSSLKSGAPVREKRRREGDCVSNRVFDSGDGSKREWYWKLPLVLLVFPMSSVSSKEVGRERFEVEKERLGSPASFRFRPNQGLSLVWIASSRSQEHFHVAAFRREAQRRENRRGEVSEFSDEGSTDSGEA